MLDLVPKTSQPVLSCTKAEVIIAAWKSGIQHEVLACKVKGQILGDLQSVVDL